MTRDGQPMGFDPTILQEIIDKGLVFADGRIMIREAKAAGYDKTQVAAALAMAKEQQGKIESIEQGQAYLQKYRMGYIEMFPSYIGDWKKLSDEVHKFENSRPLIELLPKEIKHFADHDTENLRADLQFLCVKVMERCDKLANVEHLKDGEANILEDQVKELLETMLQVWRLYEHVTNDILLRAENKTEIPDNYRKGDFSMSKILAPIVTHSEHLKRHYESLGGGKKDIRFDMKGLGERRILVNEDVITNIINNVINNAFYFSRSNILVELSLSEDTKRLIIRIINDGRPVSQKVNESGPRSGKLEIYNERFTTKGTRGLGMSDADTRLPSMGCDIQVKNNLNINGVEFNGFEIVVPLENK